MRVLLVQSHLGRVKSRPPLFPIGLSYIAAALTKHEVKIFDLNMWDFAPACEMLAKKLTEFNPDIVGISIRNIDTTQRFDIFYHFKTIRPTARLIKEINPRVKLLVGGSGFSIFAQKIMERVPEFDYGVYLEGEESVPELLDHLNSPETVKGIFIRRNNSVHFTGFREPPYFDNLPVPARNKEVIDIKQYLGMAGGINIGIQSKRGCLLDCAYCSYLFLNGRNLRLRSPGKVVDEIEYLISLKIRRFSFVDNIFNIPVSHAKAICEEIIKRGLDVKWSAWFEIKNTDEELMLLARKAGCRHFGFSPDAATDKTLSLLNKGITVKDIEKNLKMVRKIDGIKAGYNFFLMLPGMDLPGVIKTFLLYFKIPLILFGKGGGVGLGWIRIEPHTEIHRIAVEEGLLNKDTDLLPEDENALAKLFYTKPAYRYVDSFVLYIIKFLEHVIRPFAKYLLDNLLRKHNTRV